jgi:biotin carboxyl carrier protein
MSGLVSAVLVAPGGVVRRGDVVAIMEAMKMEHRLLAPADGIVTAVAVTPGTQIAARDVILTVQPDEAPL